MREIYLAATAAIGLMALAPKAQAQLAVLDGSNLAQTTQAAGTALHELTQLQLQLQQIQQTYQMFTNPSQITSMLPNLNNSFLQNSMPAANTVAGQVTANGSSASMNGYAQTFYGLNHTYTPTGNDPQATYLNQSGQSVANIQGMAAANLGSIESRLASLDDMQNTLQNATDIKQVEAINGRLAIESNAIQGQTAQAQNLQTLAVAQAQAQQLQQQSMVRQNAEAMQAAFPNEMQ